MIFDGTSISLCSLVFLLNCAKVAVHVNMRPSCLSVISETDTSFACLVSGGSPWVVLRKQAA